MSVTLRALAIGAATYVPGLRQLSGRRTGGTVSARYCYSVWLRHLSILQQNGLPHTFETVAELGPGDSLGAGLAALLCGAKCYLALDVVRYADEERNLRIFDELIGLFQNSAPIPDEAEFPLVRPLLRSYAFPADLITPELLNSTLDPKRLKVIRASIQRAAKPGLRSGPVGYLVPWRPNAIASGSVDLVFSQTVLEYASDLKGTYAEMARWLKPAGVMSHEIDFKSFRATAQWNGHWSCSDIGWHLAMGRRKHIINREPCSTHIRLTEAVGCRVMSVERTIRPSVISRPQLAKRFRHLTEDDLVTSSALIQSIKT